MTKLPAADLQLPLFTYGQRQSLTEKSAWIALQEHHQYSARHFRLERLFAADDKRGEKLVAEANRLGIAFTAFSLDRIVP